MNIYNNNDPKGKYVWSYVYLHRKAEYLSDRVRLANKWEWVAPDMVLGDIPMPGIGTYFGLLYGKTVRIIIAKRYKHIIGGRIVLADDSKGWQDICNPRRWR